MARKFIVKNRRKRKILFSILFVMLFFIGVGYSTLSTKLNIGGNLVISKVECQVNNKLYNVLKCEAEDNGLAKKYVGQHHDSFTEEPSNNIYYWYADNNTDGEAITNKNNVVFANHCWKMIRTTDTGGVKLLYNGEVEENQCLNTRGYHPGYRNRVNINFSGSYWYGTDYTYDSANETFRIAGTKTYNGWSNSMIGRYTCLSTSQNDTCELLYLVESSGYALILDFTGFSSYGSIKYTSDTSASPANVGYMYNTVYPKNEKTRFSTESVLSYTYLGTSYWFADNVTWGSPTADRYNLVDPYQISSASDYPNLVGKYTFSSSTQSYTSTTVKYIAAVDNTKAYYISLSSGNNLGYYNDTYTYGVSYTDNGNGTYTINNPTTISKTDYYSHYNDINNKFVCKNATDNTCNDIWYVYNSYEAYFYYVTTSTNYLYGNSFTYDSSTHKYTLVDTTQLWNVVDGNPLNNLDGYHYTCWNATGVCQTLSYLYYIDGVKTYSFPLTNGESMDDALTNMLHANNVNSTNSLIKTAIDAWYKKYMMSYNTFIEDTIYCNNRYITNLNHFDSNSGIVGYDLLLDFKEKNISNDLSCTYDTDKFSINNNKARLTYKVGLMTVSEMNLLGNDKARKDNDYSSSWLLSPHSFMNGTPSGTVYYLGYDGSLNNYTTGSSNRVKPAISLVANIEFSTGDGSLENPYIVQTN